MRIRIVFLFLAMLAMSRIASGAQVWLYEDVIVEDASFYTVNGNPVMQIKVTGHPVNTGCAPADEHGIVYMLSLIHI